MDGTGAGSLRERILAAAGKTVGTVEVNGVAVHLRRLSVREWMTLTGVSRDSSLDTFEKLARLAAGCLCDERGNPLFDAESAKDLSPDVCRRAWEAAAEANAPPGAADPKAGSPATPNSG